MRTEYSTRAGQWLSSSREIISNVTYLVLVVYEVCVRDDEEIH